MSLRIRKTGEIVCGAMTEEMEGDTYLHDGISYMLRVVTRAVVDDPEHEINGLCHWNIPTDMKKHWDELCEHEKSVKNA